MWKIHPIPEYYWFSAMLFSFLHSRHHLNKTSIWASNSFWNRKRERERAPTWMTNWYTGRIFYCFLMPIKIYEKIDGKIWMKKSSTSEGPSMKWMLMFAEKKEHVEKSIIPKHIKELLLLWMNHQTKHHHFSIETPSRHRNWIISAR